MPPFGSHNVLTHEPRKRLSRQRSVSAPQDETFGLRAGGSYRLVLTYDDPSEAPGEAAPDRDIVEARFVEGVAGSRVVQAVDFVSDDPASAGTMTKTWEVSAIDGGPTSPLRRPTCRTASPSTITPLASPRPTTTSPDTSSSSRGLDPAFGGAAVPVDVGVLEAPVGGTRYCRLGVRLHQPRSTRYRASRCWRSAAFRCGDLLCQFRLTWRGCQPKLTAMDIEDLGVNLSADEPALGLRASLALHRLAERVEANHVASAREKGWSWQQIGDALGVTRQSVHAKYSKESS